MNVMIRRLTLQDVCAIHQINMESLGYDFSLAETTNKLKKLLVDTTHHILLGYEDEKTIIGYVHAEIYDTLYFPTLLNVLALAVDANRKRQGVGRKLMLDLETEAKNRGIQTIRLNSGSTRSEAHTFYASLGYGDEKLQKRLVKKLSE